jgi:hypothetical protein
MTADTARASDVADRQSRTVALGDLIATENPLALETLPPQ